MTATASPPRRRRGILAFLPDTIDHFPYHADLFDADQLLAKRQSRDDQCAVQISTNDTLASTAVAAVVLLLVDPQQPNSRRVLHQLLQRLLHATPTAAAAADDMHVIVVLSSTAGLALQHSGLSVVANSNFLLMALAWTACPALAVVETATGRKVSAAAEEKALDWYPLRMTNENENNEDPVLQAWRQGRSALTWKQQVLTAVLVPSVPCTIQ
jgi:hypothetical protein